MQKYNLPKKQDLITQLTQKPFDD